MVRPNHWNASQFRFLFDLQGLYKSSIPDNNDISVEKQTLFIKGNIGDIDMIEIEDGNKDAGEEEKSK